MNIKVIEIAARAEEAKKHLSFEQRAFGKFVTAGLRRDPVTLVFEANRYVKGAPLHLQLWSSDKEDPSFWTPYVTLTKGIPACTFEADEIVVKTTDENEHLRTDLLKLGMFTDTGKRLDYGHADLEIWTLTDKFLEVFNKAMAGERSEQLEPA